MDDRDELNFDDPALKDAVRRAWAGEATPPHLRGRVGRLIATAGALHGAGESARSHRADAYAWQSRVYALAAAVVVALGVGVLVLQYQGMFDRAPVVAQLAVPPPIHEAPVPAVAQQLVARHSACAALVDHHLLKTRKGYNYGALNVQLTADLGFPVLARGIGSEWRFHGAGICQVSEQAASHLMFRRGNQTVSLFSLPISCPGGTRSGATFQGTLDGHAVAGFARGGGLYAVVGSASAGGTPPSLDMLIGIRDSLMGLFELGGCTDDTTGSEIIE